jgi:mRNA interferase MazF
VCVLTRDAAIQVLSAVTCAPITRTVRGIRSEVEVGPEEGLPEIGVITCDNIVTLPIGLLVGNRVGHLSLGKRAEMDRALRYALDIQY